MNYRSIGDISNIIRKRFAEIIPRNTELIIGVPRSGMIPATLISEYMNIPVMSLDMFKDNVDPIVPYGGSRLGEVKQLHVSDLKNIVVIDDSCATGKAITETKELLSECLSRAQSVLYGCVYATSQATAYVDFYFEIVEKLRVFEWNIMNHYLLSLCCLDLDGVLCIDPTSEQNDDGVLYRDFIINAVPLFIPRFKIGAIVTSRLEKYRELTEAWLEKNNIQYEHLFMLDFPDAESRRKAGVHSIYKAEVYSKLNAIMFIESEPWQAKYINEKTDKPVYCVGDNKMYDQDMSLDRYIERKRWSDSIVSNTDEILSTLREAQSYIEGVHENVEADYWLSMFSEALVAIGDSLSRYGSDSRLSVLYEVADIMSRSHDISLISQLDVDSIEEIQDVISQEYVMTYANKVTNKAWNSEELATLKKLSKEIVKDEIRTEFTREVEYLIKKQKIVMYPYEFADRYIEDVIQVYEDDESNYKYVVHNGHRLYFPRKTDEIIKYEYNQLIMEQDKESPHYYFSDKCSFNDDDIFVDVGSAEGIISLDVIDRAKAVYLFECDDAWIEALKLTFTEYTDKVHFIRAYAGRSDSENVMTLDTVLQDLSNENIFIKIDVEGMEKDVLRGARKVLEKNNCKCACATYHTANAEKEISEFFDSINYENAPSDNWMLFRFGHLTLKNGKYLPIEAPYFRRGLVRAWKK